MLPTWELFRTTLQWSRGTCHQSIASFEGKRMDLERPPIEHRGCWHLGHVFTDLHIVGESSCGPVNIKRVACVKLQSGGSLNNTYLKAVCLQSNAEHQTDTLLVLRMWLKRACPPSFWAMSKPPAEQVSCVPRCAGNTGSSWNKEFYNTAKTIIQPSASAQTHKIGHFDQFPPDVQYVKCIYQDPHLTLRIPQCPLMALHSHQMKGQSVPKIWLILIVHPSQTKQFIPIQWRVDVQSMLCRMELRRHG